MLLLHSHAPCAAAGQRDIQLAVFKVQRYRTGRIIVVRIRACRLRFVLVQRERGLGNAGGVFALIPCLICREAQ